MLAVYFWLVTKEGKWNKRRLRQVDANAGDSDPKQQLSCCQYCYSFRYTSTEKEKHCRAPSDAEPSLDLPARLTLQRCRNEASAAKYEMNAVLKEMKRHKKESDRVQLQQQLSIRSLKEQVALAQQALQQQVVQLLHDDLLSIAGSCCVHQSNCPHSNTKLWSASPLSDCIPNYFALEDYLWAQRSVVNAVVKAVVTAVIPAVTSL